MHRALTVLVHLFGATVAAVAAIVVGLLIGYIAVPWFQYLLSGAGVSWETRQQIAESVLRPEMFIVPIGVALLAYLAAFACCNALLRSSKRPVK